MNFLAIISKKLHIKEMSYFFPLLELVDKTMTHDTTTCFQTMNNMKGLKKTK